MNITNIVKRRAIAQDMAEHKVIYLNGKVAKPSKDVKVGDIIEIHYLKEIKKYEVLKIPQTKSIPKSAQSEYVREII